MPERRKTRFSAQNIGIGATIVGGIWTVVARKVQIPADMATLSIGVATAVATWQQLKAKYEEKDKKRRTRRHNRKGEPL